MDDVRLGTRLERAAEEQRKPLPVLVQVKLGDEETKAGLDEQQLFPALEMLRSAKRLRLEGLMTLPPYAEDPELMRPFFRRLRELRDKASAAGLLLGEELSMGMSHDLEVAVEEGATMVRVGTAVFGARAAAEERLMLVLGAVLWVLGIVLHYLLCGLLDRALRGRGGVLGQRRSPEPGRAASCARPPIRCCGSSAACFPPTCATFPSTSRSSCSWPSCSSRSTRSRRRSSTSACGCGAGRDAAGSDRAFSRRESRMKISPMDIQRQAFGRKMRGLDADEVRAYLNIVAEEVAALQMERDRLHHEVQD